MGDLGVKATYAILDDLREKVKEQHIKEPADCKQLLIDSIKAQMQIGETAYEFENRKSVVLVIGVNGVGKTTTIGKLAGKLRSDGKKVVIRRRIHSVRQRVTSLKSGQIGLMPNL